MSKKTEEVALETETPTEKLNQTAHDFYWDGRKKAFMLVTINYNRKSGVGKVIEIKEYADSKPTALHKAKELIVKKVFYSNLDDKSHAED